MCLKRLSKKYFAKITLNWCGIKRLSNKWLMILKGLSRGEYLIVFHANFVYLKFLNCEFLPIIFVYLYRWVKCLKLRVFWILTNLYVGLWSEKWSKSVISKCSIDTHHVHTPIVAHPKMLVVVPKFPISFYEMFQ